MSRKNETDVIGVLVFNPILWDRYVMGTFFKLRKYVRCCFSPFFFLRGLPKGVMFSLSSNVCIIKNYLSVLRKERKRIQSYWTQLLFYYKNSQLKLQF